MKHASDSCNLLAEGPNKLKVGDVVRNGRGERLQISEINILDAYPIWAEDERTFTAYGRYRREAVSADDITAIIRPGRTELITEENAHELYLAWDRKRNNNMGWDISTARHDYSVLATNKRI